MHELSQADMSEDPFEQFTRWFSLARDADLPEVTAMTVATVSADGKPSARMVLLKQFDQRGFVFFTNYQSRKGQQLEQNPHAALVLFWPQLYRQIRIEGTIAKVTPEESDEYFNSRPYGSRLAAAASQQSQELENREVLEAAVHKLDLIYSGGTVRRPDHWGGYRLRPQLFEFWQGRPDRLHDRFQYERTVDNHWRIQRLAP